LSKVFDARKNAEQLKRARDVNPETNDRTELVPSSADRPLAGAADGSTRSFDTAEAARSRKGPLFRSLLRMPRSESRFSAPCSASTAQRFASEPATVILPRDPIYPATAKEQLISGSVEVHFRIGPEGNVYDVTSIKGSPVLARAAVEAVQARRYEPARLDGQPIDSHVITSFDFQLS
jgi:TonB family protein